MSKKFFWKSLVFRYVSLVSLGILLTRLFHFVLLEWLTIFLFPLLILGLVTLAVIGLVGSIIFWIGSDRKSGLPFIIQVAGIVLGIFVPFEQIWLTYNFHRHLPARQQAIALIQAKQIPSSNLTELPLAYRSTSMGGEVQIIHRDRSLSVVFFTLRVMDGAQGFVYREAATPLPTDLFTGYQVLQQHPIAQNWYYARIGVSSELDFIHLRRGKVAKSGKRSQLNLSKFCNGFAGAGKWRSRLKKCVLTWVWNLRGNGRHWRP